METTQAVIAVITDFLTGGDPTCAIQRTVQATITVCNVSRFLTLIRDILLSIGG